METMNHLFDNRQFLQSIVIYGGNKVSATAPSRKHYISVDDVKRIFLERLSPNEINSLQSYFQSQQKNDFSNKATETICDEVITHCLQRNSGSLRNHKINHKEFFIERLVSEGCANAIIFLHKYYYPTDFMINKNNVLQCT